MPTSSRIMAVRKLASRRVFEGVHATAFAHHGRPAGPGARARAPFSHYFPQLPCGIGRGAGVRAFGACLRLLVQTTSTNISSRCPSLSSPRPGGLKHPSWHPRGYLLAAGCLPHERPVCPLVLTLRLRVVRPGGESEVKRPSGREWGSVLFGPIWKSSGYPTAKPSPSPLLRIGVERRFPCAFSPLSLTSLLPSVRVVQ